MEVAIRAGALLAECPRWDTATGRLLWVDIEAHALHVFDPATGEDRSILLDDRVGAAAPTTDGGVLVALADRLAMVDLDDESVSTLVEIPHGDGLRLNDGVCDPASGFGGEHRARLRPRPRCALPLLEPGGPRARARGRHALERDRLVARRRHDVLHRLDGLPGRRIDLTSRRCDLKRRPLIVIERGAGIPDGLAVDDEGGIWVALWGRAAIHHYEPDGELERVLEVPADNVTACCFGGDDGRSLYVTTASVELPAERRSAQPLAGSVFVTDAGVSGPSGGLPRGLSRSRRVGEEDGALGGRADERPIAREDA